MDTSTENGGELALHTLLTEGDDPAPAQHLVYLAARPT